jgi:phage baseplate assembly protein W
MQARIPHLRFPFARGPDGGVLTVEQDTTEHILGCENVIVRCPTGFRWDRPEFGWPWPLFHNAPLDLGPLEAALSAFEPRARVTTQEAAELADAATRRVTVNVGTDA